MVDFDNKLYRRLGITAKKHNGDDSYSWAVFVNGRPVISGLHKSEVDYFKRQVAKGIIGKEGAK